MRVEALMPTPHRITSHTGRKRPLYFMAKPTPELAQQIWSHSRTDRRRPASLLHLTVLSLVDLATFPPETLGLLCKIMAPFKAAPFRVIFDRIEDWHVVALRGSEPIHGARMFQKRLEAFLRSNGFPFIGQRPEAHLTINYRRDGRGLTSIDPVSWTVDELLLVESVFGETRHVVHGRWTLKVVRDPLCGLAQ